MKWPDYVQRARAVAGPLYDARFLHSVSGSLLMGCSEAMARSFASCDVPLSGEFTGSANCGDRNFVIEAGQRLSASLVTSLSVVAAISAIPMGLVVDRHNRHRLVMLSSVLHFVQNVVFAVALSEFVSSQTGMVLLYLAYIITAVSPPAEEALWQDLCDGDEALRSDIMLARNGNDLLSGGLAAGLCIKLLSLQVVNFAWLPAVLSLLSACQMHCIWKQMALSQNRGKADPQADSKADPKAAEILPSSLWEGVMGMLKEVLQLCAMPVVIWTILHAALTGISMSAMTALTNAHLMSAFGWQQHALPSLLLALGMFSYPLMCLGTWLYRRWGIRAVALLTALVQSLCPFFRLLCPLSPTPLLVIITMGQATYLMAPASPGLQAKLPQGRSHLRGRSGALFNIIGQLANAFWTVALTALFKPGATVFWESLSPWLFVAVVEAASVVVYFLKLWPLHGVLFDELTEEMLALDKAAAGKQS